MKKILLFTAIIAVLTPACQKSTSSSGNNGGYYIKANIDGTAKNFSTNAMALKMNMGNAISLSIAGQVGAATSLEGINITINTTPDPGKTIVAGTYNELETDHFVTAAVYNPGSTTIVWGAGMMPNPPHPLTVVITAIDSKTIKGTFSGDFYYTNTQTAQFGPDKKSITNGEFYVKF